MKKNKFRVIFVLASVFALSGWYFYNLQNYTFYYSDSERKEILEDRNKISVMSLKIQYDECFWEETYECRETMRALKFKGYITDKDWKIVDDNFYNPTEEAKRIRLAALNKMYDKRANEEKAYKSLKYFNQFLFEEILILISILSVIHLFKERKLKLS
jgi:hypothetical protein